MQPRMVEQEEEVLLEEVAAVPRPWANRKVLGVVGVVGLAVVGTAAVLPRKWSSKAAIGKDFIEAQQYGPYGAAQGYGGAPGAGVGGGGFQGAALAPHPPAFIPFAQAQAMAGGGAGAQPPFNQPAPAPAGFPGPYGAHQGYGAGVGHGPQGAPIAAHPETFVAHADAPAQQQQGNGGGGDKPVTLNIYYETKCPFSKQFIDGEVKPALSDAECVFKHVHINWEPYGNVQDAGGALVCQHGPDECFGNKLHLCAKQQFGGDEVGLNNFITCHIAFLTASNGDAKAMAGYAKCGGDAQRLTDCANNPSIFDAFRQVGQETKAAHTEHMPWAIMGNGQPNLQGQLVPSLCQMYGTGALAAFPKPGCCL